MPSDLPTSRDDYRDHLTRGSAYCPQLAFEVTEMRRPRHSMGIGRIVIELLCIASAIVVLGMIVWGVR